MKLMTISEFSKRCGVRPETLRRWESAGKITPIRTCGRHRRYTEANFQESVAMKLYDSTMPQSVAMKSYASMMSQYVSMNSNEAKMPQAERVILYCRTSPQEQGQLERQILVLRMFSLWQGFHDVELIAEVADGIDMQRPELLSLMHKIISGKVDRLVVAHKDRLVPFGFELLEYIAETCGCKITVLDQVSIP